MPDKDAQHTLPVHGAAQLPRVVVDSYNLEIEDTKGFVGDKASKSAFTRMLDDIRKTLRDDPFGDTPSETLGKKKLDAALREGTLTRRQWFKVPSRISRKNSRGSSVAISVSRRGARPSASS